MNCMHQPQARISIVFYCDIVFFFLRTHTQIQKENDTQEFFYLQTLKNTTISVNSIRKKKSWLSSIQQSDYSSMFLNRKYMCRHTNQCQ
jgi:hypothetical protein